MSGKAFFLDRDGTINKDTGYISRVEDMVLLPGAAEAVRMLNEAGYLVIVVSNQSGVARGYYDISVAEATNRRLNELLEEEGAHIDAFYICPHHPEGAVKEYAVRCDCRKPGTALFERAIRDFGLDPSRCYACGDRARDVERLPELGIPGDHLGVLDGVRYHDLKEFTTIMLEKDRS